MSVPSASIDPFRRDVGRERIARPQLTQRNGRSQDLHHARRHKGFIRLSREHFLARMNVDDLDAKVRPTQSRIMHQPTQYMVQRIGRSLPFLVFC